MMLPGEMQHQTFIQGTQRLVPNPGKSPGMLNEIEHPRVWSIRTFYLLDLELFCPGDDRTPDELVEQYDHGNHGSDAPKNGARVARAGSGLQVGTQPGEPEVSGAQHEHLAGHQEQPAAGYRHHRVPHQSDGGERQLHLNESLPPAEPVNLRGLPHVFRNALERRVKAEGHISTLAGK